MKECNRNGGESHIKLKIIKLSVVLCIIILVLSSYLLIRNFIEYKESNASNEELIEKVINKNNEDTGNNIGLDILEIDWNKLESINSDIVGWIKIEDTKINYPILKDNDNLKYINHSFNGKYNKNGSIFTLNNNPFEDDITVIYGHNMKSGIMFAALGKYMDSNFFNEHQTFYIYTKNQNYKATIFSCYSIQVNQEETNIKNLSFDEEVNYYKSKSKIQNQNIGEIKKIVKLSTCSYLNNHTTPTNQRYFVIASLNKA